MHENTDIVLGIRLTRQFPVEEIVGNCWETLHKHTRNFRLIVIDDNSDEHGAQFIDSLVKGNRNVILIRTGFQHWFTRAFNLGLRLVRTPHVVTLNCDCVMDANWLDELYAVRDIVRDSHGRVGLVGSVLSGEEPRRYSLTAKPAYVTGHCWLLNMEAITQVSVVRGTPGIYLDEIDPNMIHIRSDVDLTWKLLDCGWHVVSSYKSAVGHQAGKTWGHQLGSIPASIAAVSYTYS